MSVRKRKDDGKWMVHFVCKSPDGQRIEVRKVSTVQTKAGAEQFEAKLRHQIETGTFGAEEEVQEERRVTMFAEYEPIFISDYAAVKNKHSEVEAKKLLLRVHLVPFFGAMLLTQIGERQIDAYIAKKKKDGLKPKTINNHLGVLGKMLRQAKRWKLVKEVPDFDWLVVRDQEFDYLTFEEAEQLLRAADEEPWRTMMLVAMKTGLRPGELRALRWKDVDFSAGRLFVRQGEYKGLIDTPKDGDAREVELSAEALAALRRHRHLRGEYVFCREDGTFFTEPAMKKPLARACKKAGLRPLSWYAFRHTFASHLVMRGVPLKAVGELMGHSTIEMTMRYAHLSPVVKRDAVRLLDQPIPEAYSTKRSTNEKAPSETAWGQG